MKEEEISRRSFLRRFGLGSLIIATTPKVLGAFPFTKADVENYSALDLFGGKEAVIKKRIEFARKYLEGASEKELLMSYAVSGNFYLGNTRKEEMIEKIIACSMEEDGMGILFSSIGIAPLEVMGMPNFQNSKIRNFWLGKMREDILVRAGLGGNLEQYVAREAGDELSRAILEERERNLRFYRQ